MNVREFWTDYQKATQETAIYPGQGSLVGLVYVVLGLAGETGEVCDNVKKVMRDDGNELLPERLEKLRGELGDVLWYLARSARELNFDLGDVVAGIPSDVARQPVPGLGTPTGVAFLSLTLFCVASRFGDEVSRALIGDGVSGPRRMSPLLTDVFYVANQLAFSLNLDLQDVARANRDKLLDRKNRGVLKGSGDTR